MCVALMEKKLCGRSQKTERLKERFLTALQHNDAAVVELMLQTTNIDINTIFDVEDRTMVLASYKQGTQTQGIRYIDRCK